MDLPKLFTLLLFFAVLQLGCGTDTNPDQETPIEEPKGKRGLLEKGDTYLEYRIEGEGKQCIVLGSMEYHSRSFSKNLREHVQLIFLNMPWYVSDYYPQDINTVTLDSLCLDIEKLRKKLELETFVLIGHSMNGLIALEYARQFPQHVSDLVLISVPAHKSPEGSQIETEYWAMEASPERRMKYEDTWGRVKDSISTLNINDRAIANDIANSAIYYYDFNYNPKWLWEDVFVNTYVMSHMLAKIFRSYDIGHGIEVSPRTFLALGKYNFSSPPPLWGDFRTKVFQSLTTQVFDESGHLPQLEEPEKFDEIFLKWLKKE